MLSSQYKNLAFKLGCFSKSCYTFSSRNTQTNYCKRQIYFKLFQNRFSFSTKKSEVSQKKQEKQFENKNNEIEGLEYLWKTNLALNVVGIGAGFYFPAQTLMFIITSNSMFQACEQSKYIYNLKEFTEKEIKKPSSTSDQFVHNIRQHFKKIVISIGIIFSISIAIGLSSTQMLLKDYSLLGLNFWILFNIKFNMLSHGYYFVLLSLALFQYLYFQKVFDENKQKIPFQIL